MIWVDISDSPNHPYSNGIYLIYDIYIFYDSVMYIDNGWSIWNFDMKKWANHPHKKCICIVQFIIKLYEELRIDYFITLLLSSISCSILFVLVKIIGIYNILWGYSTVLYNIIILLSIILCITFIARYFSYTYKLKMNYSIYMINIRHLSKVSKWWKKSFRKV